MPGSCWDNFLNVLFVERGRDDPPHQYRLQKRKKPAANDSAPCAKRLRATSPRSVSPAQHNASLPANPTDRARSDSRRHIGNRVHEVALPDSGPVGAGKIVDTGPDSWPGSAVCWPRTSRPAYKCLLQSEFLPGLRPYQFTINRCTHPTSTGATLYDPVVLGVKQNLDDAPCDHLGLRKR